MIFEYPHFTLDGNLFVPMVYDAGLGEPIPDGFNAVRIPLDGGLRSNLHWTEALDYADQAAGQGLKILWDIDLGLFSRLPLPLSDETQFRTLALALEHLLNLIRERFLPVTLGVVLYRGNLDLSVGFPWDIEGRQRTAGWNARAVRLDCRNQGFAYLRQLSIGWPDHIPAMALLDAYRVRSILDVILLTDRQYTKGFVQVVRGGEMSGQALGWDRASSFGLLARRPLPVPLEPLPSTAVCLPQTFPFNYDFTPLEKRLTSWVAEGRPFRIVTEEFLTTEWDGLDLIVVDEQMLNPTGLRKLQGFQAAGGLIQKY